jgi:hypothetical protein
MHRTSLVAVVFLAVVGSGCVSGKRASAARPLGMSSEKSEAGGRGTHRIAAPEEDRCQKAADGLHDICAKVRDEGARYVARLSVDDQVCLDGLAMEKPTVQCKVRAFVADTAPQAVKLEIRESPPGSKYLPMDMYWYAEGALVDRYLQMSGF